MQYDRFPGKYDHHYEGKREKFYAICYMYIEEQVPDYADIYR